LHGQQTSGLLAVVLLMVWIHLQKVTGARKEVFVEQTGLFSSLHDFSPLVYLMVGKEIPV